MAAHNASTSATADAVEREVVITRIFDAPRELVFRAWTDPEHMARWWGPGIFTNPVVELDVRPGGEWYIVMRGPDGTDYPCGGVYREVVEPERLVFTNDARDPAGNPVLRGLTTVTFADYQGKTRLTLRTRATAMNSEAVPMLAGMEAGWTDSIDRLGSLVTGCGDREIATARVFAAPRDRVFDMWVDAQHIGKWWGPQGFRLTIHAMDVRPGGEWRFVMHGPDGRDYQNRIVYREIARPELLVLSHVSGPVFEMTVRFVEFDRMTWVSVRMLFPSPREFEKAAREFGAVEGLGQTLDRLGEQLRQE